MTDPLFALLREHDAYIPTDNPFQRRARLLQALWRAEQGLEAGVHRGRALGSRLAMPDAEHRLTNYITETIRAVVRREVLDAARSRDKLFGRPRIFNDLLSSQPLCFNLFGELAEDLGLASKVFAAITSGRVREVTSIGFEHSPGRGLAKYTGDRSAFDVFVEYVAADGAKGFAGIEVKYHEDLDDRPAPHRDRYDVIAQEMAAFDPTSFERLRAKPLQQIWRDHLLAGSLLLDREAGYADGFFGFLYPAENECCAKAVASYRAKLVDDRSFVPWTIEDVVAAVRAAGGGAWIDVFADRYLGFGKIAAL